MDKNMATTRTALFPGSFDPITLGHVEIIERGLALFDKIVVAIGVNSQKKYMFSLEERIEMLQTTFQHHSRIEVAVYEDLTVAFAKKNNISFLLRGLRGANDLTYEQPIAYINQLLHPGIEVICLLSKPDTAHISSTIVREIIRYKGSTTGLLPPSIIRFIEKKFGDVEKLS
jgi:pantetheine-phosphate adenylyltransferase